ncbi:hypothetical protein BGZ80_005332 [Entomortierella chlamydospora]|uniref:Uncharacterized protein n=1 Tax=Entomortierella chlamydospora TaxID=101097 RepID=A0A9P6SV16_9FUNG|nr:hypothetical protein BGZ79_001996 [Entomortierella chlamydospora]KAG0006196.1 hypothetical protein BGZ80_005332 [Entomortierella chlamydospora]
MTSGATSIPIGTVDQSLDNVDRFFHLVDGRYWSQIELVFKHRDPSKTADQHYDSYHSSLNIIRNSTLVNASLKDQAQKIFSRLLYTDFIATFTGLLEKDEQKSAQSSVRGLYLGVTNGLNVKRPALGPSKVTSRMSQEDLTNPEEPSSSSSSALHPPTKSRIPRPTTALPTLTAAKSVAKRKNSAIVEPWRSVVEQLLEKIKGGNVTLPEEWPKKLSGFHEMLYKFIESKIQGSVPMSKLVEKDVYVAMSGIVNARMDGARDVFGEEVVNLIEAQCLRPDIVNPSEQLKAILDPLQEAFRAGETGKMIDVVEAALGVEASARLVGAATNPLKRRVLDAIRHICIKKPSRSMSEGELVEVWSYVLNALAGNKLSLRSGELTSKATRWQRLLMKQEYDMDPGLATYGRKLDLQCRVGELELNNSEFKADTIPPSQVEIQYRKNLRVNQAMMLYLKEQIDMPLQDLDVLALDVHGLSAVVFALKYNGEVFVSSLATKHLLRLPDSPASWRQFLRGNTLSVLLAYVEHLLDFSQRIEDQELNHEELTKIDIPRTPEVVPRPLGDFTFFSPSRRKDTVNLQLLQKGIIQEGEMQGVDLHEEYEICEDEYEESENLYGD